MEKADSLRREDDHELVRRLVSTNGGEAESAFTELYEKYKRRVYATACRILHDRNLAADATQAAFLTILRKADRFDFRSAFSSWIYRVTVNQCIDLS